MTALPIVHGRQFRLLKIRSIGSTIECEVQPYELPGSSQSHLTPEYTAISYTWGNQPRSCSIIVNDQLFWVTPNVQTLLSHLYFYSTPPDGPICSDNGVIPEFSALRDRWYWIDQICIDQEDLLDKKVQVENMHIVYTSATMTFVWLGFDEVDIERAIDHFMAAIQSWNEAQSSITYAISASDELLDRFRCDEAAWHAVCRLFAHQWFNRVWVVQEIVLSRVVHVLCSRRTITWDDLLLICQIFQRVWLVHSVFNTDHEVAMRAYKQSLTCRHLDSLRASGKIHDPLVVLARLSGKDVHFPIDQLFGIRGMLTEEQRSWIEVDYEKPEIDVWINFFKTTLLEGSGWLGRILDHAVSNVDKRPGTPSWCPNIDARHEEPAVLTLSYYPTFLVPFEDTLKHTHVRLVDQPKNGIALLGKQIGTVSRVLPALSEVLSSNSEGRWNDFCQWEAQCYAAFQSTCSEDVATDVELELYARTMVGEHFCNPNTPLVADPIPEDEIIWPDYLAFRDKMEACALDPLAANIPWLRRHEKFIQTISILELRKLFIMENGKFGLGPHLIQPDDSIFALDGCPFLWVLRQRPDSSAYSLIGDAYIHGSMFLGAEALERETGNPEIVIV